MQKTVVLLVVGLAGKMIGDDTPNLARLAGRGKQLPLKTITPAVTCSVQATFMTGTLPSSHGCVGNGWYFRDLAEVWLWRQPEQLVAGEKIWDAAKKKDSTFTCAKTFWWYNMYSTADYQVTPRPMYPVDGRKLPDIWTWPTKLRDDLQEKLGQFPLFHFWGPTADIRSSQWIADSALEIDRKYNPTLQLVYLPHLDYNVQRLGPDDPAVADDLRQIDRVCGKLIDHFERQGTRIIVLSEYGITPASKPVHINRALRGKGWIKYRLEEGHEMFDAGASDVFAVADHQIAHIYVKNEELIPEVIETVEALDGVERVLDAQGKKEYGLDHPNSGELVAIAKPDAWFTYYYWLEDKRAPDYARTVDIHRKPGYDPVELFLNPRLPLIKARVALKLLRKIAGFRTVMDLIGLDASLVRGSHGRITDDPREGPVFITSEPGLLGRKRQVAAVDVKELVLDHIFTEKEK